MNEAETRAEYIDPALAAAGWGVVEGSRIRREYPITLGRIEGNGKRGKALTADYVLEYRNTKLAVVEAKAWQKALTEGVGQAKDYAGKLSIRFTYASNGQGIYSIDMHTGAEGELEAFPSPEELWHATFAAENAANEATSSSGGAMKKALSRLASGAVGSASASYDCKKGGSITAKVSVEGDDDSAQIHASLHVGLRVEEQFHVAHSGGMCPLQVGHGDFVEVLAGAQHQHVGIEQVQE